MKKILILVFDIPRENAYLRVKTWRKLKELGAELKYGSHWVLFYTKENLIRLEKICEEIRKFGGKAEVIKGEKIG
ncbi:MAG: hypothetical protein QMD14_05090 [Candidatus Aenigmarchaeota archaeon]|nr:hypothetical protein [Candidatus Aenigmarchaeota archaeon]